MSTPPISPTAAGSRESARQKNGEFGIQPAADVSADVDLMVGSPEFDKMVAAEERATRIVCVVDDWLAGDAGARSNFDRDVADELPAIYEDVDRNQSFAQEYLYPMLSAGGRGEWDTTVEMARRLVELNDAEQAYLDQDWRPGVGTVSGRDDMYGPTYTGAQYESSRPLTEVAKLMRADIKDAQAAGYIPDDLNYRVVKSDNTLRIIVEGMPDEDSQWRDHNSPYAHGREFVARPSWAANRLNDRLKGIGLAYAQQQNAGQVDYWNNSHYVTVDIRKENEELFWRHEAAKKKLAADIKKTPVDAPGRAELVADAKAQVEAMKAEEASRRQHDRETWGW